MVGEVAVEAVPTTSTALTGVGKSRKGVLGEDQGGYWVGCKKRMGWGRYQQAVLISHAPGLGSAYPCGPLGFNPSRHIGDKTVSSLLHPGQPITWSRHCTAECFGLV